MGLVVIVVGILAEDDNFDSVKWGVAGPKRVQSGKSKVLR